LIKKHKFEPSDNPAFMRGNRCRVCGYPESDEAHDLEEQTTLF